MKLLYVGMTRAKEEQALKASANALKEMLDHPDASEGVCDRSDPRRIAHSAGELAMQSPDLKFGG